MTEDKRDINYPPCIVCGKAGDTYRNVFVPIAPIQILMQFGLVIALCSECSDKYYDERIMKYKDFMRKNSPQTKGVN